MNNSSLEKLSMNISNSWIIGCSILTYGIMTFSYLNGVSDLSIIHMKRKNSLELQQIEKTMDFSEKMKNEDKLISHYWKHYKFIFMTGISGLSVVAFITIVKK